LDLKFGFEICFFPRAQTQADELSKFLNKLSYMHTACVLCVFWAHASDFVTSRPFVMPLVWSAFE